MTATPSDPDVPAVQDPPRGFLPIVRQLGPGLIIAASIVGSGELIMTTKLGSDVGFTLLWFIIIGCLIKVFVQIEFGRYAIAHGQTTLQALDSLPGPRLGVSWMVYLWFVMYLGTFCQVAGMIGALGDAFQFGGVTWNPRYSALLVALSCSLLLVVGRYRLVERSSTIMVAGFTAFTVFAVGGLYWTDYAISWDNLWQGLQFHLPEHQFKTAFAAFGIIGVGASELIYYPYWCLEKGYGRSVGANDGSPAWGTRARGWMRVLEADAWVSLIVYTSATIAFYLLGAAILHGKSLAIDNDNLIPNLSHMYREQFGEAGRWIFLGGAFVVLYSTVFIATASNARLFADVLVMLRCLGSRESNAYSNTVRAASGLLPIGYFLLLLVSANRPLDFVFVGAIGQAYMLPLLCLTALYFHHTRMEGALRTRPAWTVLLWISASLMLLTGCYQVVNTLKQFLSGS